MAKAVGVLAEVDWIIEEETDVPIEEIVDALARVDWLLVDEEDLCMTFSIMVDIRAIGAQYL